MAIFSCLMAISISSHVNAYDSNWTEQIKLNGDFRYRYEFIDEKENRHRNRLRLRLGINAQVNNNVDVGIMFVSGGESPGTTNQTLDSQSSTKDLRLDQAYFAWNPLNNLTIKGGKFNNPFYRPVKTSLLWDNDIRPEGLVLKYKNYNIFINTGFFYLEERSQDDDSLLFGGQIGYQTNINKIKFTIGSSIFNYTDIKGRPLSDFSFLNSKEKSFGNTLDAANKFVTDYQEWEIFGDITVKIAGIPVTLFVDYVVNTIAENIVSNNDSAYLVGFKVGSVNKTGSWDFKYNYRKLESDSLFGTFTDSSFGGGGTDVRGHFLNFGYQIDKGWKFETSFFLHNKRDLEAEIDYQRVKVDLKFKF
ncbi:MAG: putative porin [Thiomargarita sp.]|nr:putative porin [Thiomargarita sp.]